MAGARKFSALKAINSSANRGEITCYFCKAHGHMKRDCPKYKNWLQKKKLNEQKASVVKSESDDQFLFISAAADGWIVDSGATCHIIGTKNSFIDFDPKHRESIYVADGNQVQALGKGTVSVDFMNDYG